MLSLTLNIMLTLHSIVFFLNDTPPTEIYTLSLHDALPICDFVLGYGTVVNNQPEPLPQSQGCPVIAEEVQAEDRKSTRLNSSHQIISYAVFCLKKKKSYIYYC